MTTDWPVLGAEGLVWRRRGPNIVLSSLAEGDVAPRLLLRLREHLRLAGRPCDDYGVFTGEGAITLGAATVAHWDGQRCTSVTRLCPFELRYLADTGYPHPRARTGNDSTPITDLHTHLAGCAAPAALIDLGLKHDLALDGALWDEVGVRAVVGALPLRTMGEAHLAKLRAALCLPPDRQSTFRDMERAYRLRAPFTRSLELFPDLLDTVAAAYAAMGVRYVELSLGDLYRQAWLQAAVEGARRALDRHGVTLRFLLAISRHNDPEWDDDLLARLEALGGCRELVGVDWMGHETNSTRAFAARITRVADWAHAHRPGFVIRVHAGENPAFPENVGLACAAVVGSDVTLRIGHALYGWDTALAALRSTRAVVEINLTSNFTLNNIQSTADVPLRQLLAARIPCVLGTDGPGLYGTTPVDELRAARLAGLTDDERALLRQTETTYLARAAELSATVPPSFAIPPDAPLVAYTPEVVQRKIATRAAHRAALQARLQAMGTAIRTDMPAAPAVLCIAGAWKGAWANASTETKDRISAVLEALIPRLPQGTLLITGGTSAGVEGEVHRLALRHRVRVLATLVEATPPDDLGRGPTDALFIAQSPHEKATRLYALMRDVDALCLFFGGGNVVHDELRAAANLRLRYLALADVDGASGRHAALCPQRAFRSADDVLRRLDDRAYFREAFAPFWHPGVNPTVDVVVQKGTEVLLIRRHEDAAAEPGQWALPGGFVQTSAARGAPFVFDEESALEAAVRELREESGLDLSALQDQFRLVAEIEGGGRDERDTPAAWSRTSLFTLELDEAHARQPIAGGDDASDARWFPLAALPARLAFDHRRLITLACHGR